MNKEFSDIDWIDVNDRLPEHKQEINFMGKFPLELCGFFEKTEKGHVFFYKNRKSNIIYKIFGVTHWRANV